jgi:hypothetical protein
VKHFCRRGCANRWFNLGVNPRSRPFFPSIPFPSTSSGPSATELRARGGELVRGLSTKVQARGENPARSASGSRPAGLTAQCQDVDWRRTLGVVRICSSPERHLPPCVPYATASAGRAAGSAGRPFRGQGALRAETDSHNCRNSLLPPYSGPWTKSANPSRNPSTGSRPSDRPAAHFPPNVIPIIPEISAPGRRCEPAKTLHFVPKLHQKADHPATNHKERRESNGRFRTSFALFALPAVILSAPNPCGRAPQMRKFRQLPAEKACNSVSECIETPSPPLAKTPLG